VGHLPAVQVTTSSRLRARERFVHPTRREDEARCVCASMKPATTARPPRSIKRVPRPLHRSACASAPTTRIRSPRTARALAHGLSFADVKIRPPTRTTLASPATEDKQGAECKSSFAHLRLASHRYQVAACVFRCRGATPAASSRAGGFTRTLYSRPEANPRETVEGGSSGLAVA
jgi:hypothetical protein